jgi:acetyl-CoA C-acetyltransferase
MEREAWIIDAVRSPRGKGKESGALHNVHPQRILAQVLNGLSDRLALNTADVWPPLMLVGHLMHLVSH